MINIVFIILYSSFDMEKDEYIQAHILSVWRESKKLFSMHGTEGMLVLTDKHLMFIHKTESKMNWWKAITQRQVVNFIKSKNTMIRHDGYDDVTVRNDRVRRPGVRRRATNDDRQHRPVH